jgi:hypothetical protein
MTMRTDKHQPALNHAALQCANFPFVEFCVKGAGYDHHQ